MRLEHQGGARYSAQVGAFRCCVYQMEVGGPGDVVWWWRIDVIADGKRIHIANQGDTDYPTAAAAKAACEAAMNDILARMSRDMEQA